MAERTTAKEVSIDLAGFKSSVDKQISLLTRLVLGIYVLIGAVVGGGFLLRTDLGEIKVEEAKTGEKVDGLRRDVTAVQDRIGKLTSDISDSQKQIAAMQTEIVADLAHIDAKLPAPAISVLALSPDEEEVIRFFFGLPKGLPSAPSKYKIGDVPFNVKPIPNSLVAKLPRLKGLGYTTDPNNGSILICDAVGRIVAIVAPV